MPSKSAIMSVAVGTTTLVAGCGFYYLYIRNKRSKANKEKLEQIIELLDQENCVIKDIALLRGKLAKFVNGGKHEIQIIADFDRTLTNAFVDGQPAHASYGVIDDSSYIPDSAVQELNDLKKKYFPIEMSTRLSEAEKLPLMVEWYTASFQVAIKSGIKKHMLPSMVRESSVHLRDGCDQFFKVITEKKIPLLVLSAGVGDIIEEILKQQAEIPPQIKLIANFYSYDSDGKMCGRKGDLIHTFNKNDVSKGSSTYFNGTKNCKKVLLLGDSLGDPAMADGVDYMDEIIKIGFLNNNVEESLTGYLAAYDIVLTNDSSMDMITLMLHQITKE